MMETVPIPVVMALPATQISRVAKEITVLIEGPGNNGTGVIINKRGNAYTLLTAGHVVASIHSGEEAYALTQDGQRHQINTRNISIILGVDLAIVEFVSNRNYSTAKLGNGERLLEGMTVYVAGFPLPTAAIDRSIYTFVPGKVTSASSQGLKDGYGLIYNNNTLPGMSGGPVLNEQGEVVAIHGRADTAQTQATGYDNIYVKTGLNLGIPLSQAILGQIQPTTPTQTALQHPPEIIIDPVPNYRVPVSSSLVSQATGVDYTSLRDLLKARQWEKADARTYDLIVMAGDRDHSGGITSTELEDIACEDLQTIDRLWLEYSQGKFGFSVQKRIYETVGNFAQVDVNAYRQFAQIVGWKKASNDNGGYYLYDELNFSLNAPSGHLPRWSWGLNIAVVYSRMSYLTERLNECKL
ncbi:GUN4 domain-containing protein [Crocosphaera sp. UHCC 0190]|uniref:GUN4 domain-containing protein n=1 Tax=Crocosphaera sp. UHCC 0190 TaxID=3110246 RepID=UPI002B220E67|nr:GUN4 domain-containing protein [Crocosphaera sp. UHCC 0190]MEA5509557.1 GUN4 domain-containing protein [Crocosphaera sp. UHCC 0190]